MELERRSGNVVIPDMAESRTNETEVDENIEQKNVPSVHVTAVEVPVSSIPVGSLINVGIGTGETFNLITSDQIQLTSNGEFLCVDNNCNSGDIKESEAWHTLVRTESGNLNTAHVVIQNGNNEVMNDGSSDPDGIDKITYTYEEAVNLPVLHVRCKNTNAELHKEKFGSGGRGRCIRLNNEWLTPSEFEAFCGRASSKDWKRSIRFGGRSLQSLIDEQILIPHATSCTCSTCCDDVNAAGPIRLFTPYKRQKRSSSVRRKRKPGDTTGSNDDDSCDSGPERVESWALTSDTQRDESRTHTNSTSNNENADIIIVNSVDEPNNGNLSASSIADVRELFKKMNEMSGKMLKLAHTMRNSVKEMEIKWNLDKDDSGQTKDKGSNYEPALTVDDSANLILRPDGDNVKKCANCNREAHAECSTCRRTSYCSTFCQRKDWAIHQVNCNNPDQSELMLIVGNQ